MNNIERALLVAEKAHANQSYDIYPYMYHIRQVMNIAVQLGYDESIVIGCILHDTLEDTDLSYNDIKKGFGEEVAEIVYAVTDEMGRNRKERKEKTYPKIRANWKATVVKICDRVANTEHSRGYNQKHFQMYVNEYPFFKKALWKDVDHPEEVERAWARLISSFTIDLNNPENKEAHAKV